MENEKQFLIDIKKKYDLKNDDDIFDICSKLNERIIFLTFSNKGKYIEQIYVYLPSKKDTMLFVNDGCIGNNTEEFITDLAKKCPDLIRYHSQEEKPIITPELDYSKEFFTFTNLKINNSTVTFHYVP